MGRLFLLGVQQPRLVGLLLLLVTVSLGAGLPQLRVDAGFDSLIPSNDPARLVYQRITREFGSDNRSIIYVREPELWTPDKLRRLDELQRKLKLVRYVNRVDSLFSLRTLQGEAGHIDAQTLIDRVPDVADEIRRIRVQAQSNPLFEGNFLSVDGGVTAIIVTALNPEQAVPEDEFNDAVHSGIETVLAAHRADFDRLFQVGPPRITAEIKASLLQDLLILGPLSALVLLSAILFFMRSGIAAILPLVTSAVTIIWTFGLLGWLGVPLNMLSAMIPSLIIVIGATEDTHIVATFQEARANASETDNTRTALLHVARLLGIPLLLTVLTTALGFATNLVSSIGLIQDFALAASFAMLANGLITVLLAPLMLAAFDSFQGSAPSVQEAAEGLPRWVIRQFRVLQDRFPRYTLVLTAVLCVFFLIQASRLQVTNDPLSYFPPHRPLVQDANQIHEDLAGIRVFFIALESPHDEAFLEPDNIARLARIQEFLNVQGVYDRSLSLADHLSYVNRAFRGRAVEPALPGSRELIAQYLLFFHRSELSAYVSHDLSRANIIVRHNISDSHTLSEKLAALEVAVSEIAGPEVKASIIGENLMINRAVDSLLVTQIEALVLILGLVFLIMSAMFTSFRGGAMALVPAVIPIAVMFGVMGLLDIPLNPGTAMVAVIAIGIAVDGTIHLLSRYNDLCRRTSDYVSAVRQAVDEEATPLVVSGLALAMGFGVLMFSNFTIVSQFGALAAATMLVSILANLLITPIIMSRTRLVGLHQILSMRVDPRVFKETPLFQGMSNYQRRKAIVISEMQDYAVGENVVVQGSHERSMYLILEGEAEVIFREDGQETQVATLRAGEIFGEIGYIRAVERIADVRALTAVSVLRFDYLLMQKNLRYFPGIAAKLHANMSAVLGERIADLEQRPSGFRQRLASAASRLPG